MEYVKPEIRSISSEEIQAFIAMAASNACNAGSVGPVSCNTSNSGVIMK